MRLIIRLSGRILTREPTAASLGLNHIEVFSNGNDKSIKQKALYGNDGTLECFDWENFFGGWHFASVEISYRTFSN